MLRGCKNRIITTKQRWTPTRLSTASRAPAPCCLLEGSQLIHAEAAGKSNLRATPAVDGPSSIRPDYQRMLYQFHAATSFDHQPVPRGCWMEVVSGSIPEGLAGTYFRNGPGKFKRGNEHYGHAFDGDGLVASVAVKGGCAFFTSRFVETAEFKAEEAAGKVLFRGVFAAARAGGWVNNALNILHKNPSNTNVLLWGSKLLSLYEGRGPCYCLDPTTLATVGMENLGGRLHPGMTFYMDPQSSNARLLGAFLRALGDNRLLPAEFADGGGSGFSAHPHVDPATGRLCIFTFQSDMETPGLVTTLWELEPGSMNIHSSRMYLVKDCYNLHDFAVTENYYIMHQPPLQADPQLFLSYLLGQASPTSCVTFNPGTPSYIHVIPRPGSAAARSGQHPRVVPADPAFVVHHANAYEEPSGSTGGLPTLVLDSVYYNDMPGFPEPGHEHLAPSDPYCAFKGRLCRARIDLAAGSVAAAPLYTGQLDFPTINDSYYGGPCRYIYAETYSSPADPTCHALLKVDTHTGATTAHTLAPGVLLNEPKFVPFPKTALDSGSAAEDDGWLLAISIDTSSLRTELLVLDARDLEAGPLAVLAVPHPLPMGFHGSWSSTYFGPAMP